MNINDLLVNINDLLVNINDLLGNFNDLLMNINDLVISCRPPDKRIETTQNHGRKWSSSDVIRLKISPRIKIIKKTHNFIQNKLIAR